jgi:hypothetical protein
MTTVPKDDFRALPHVIAFGAAGAAIVGVFFGVGFFLLSPPNPTAPSADPGLQAGALVAHEIAPNPVVALKAHEVLPDSGLQTQAPEAQEIAPPPNNDTVSGTSSAPPAEETAPSPMSSTVSDGKASALGSTAMETKLIAPAGITRAKRLRIVLHHRQIQGTQWGVLWRPDVAGPIGRASWSKRADRGTGSRPTGKEGEEPAERCRHG